MKYRNEVLIKYIMWHGFYQDVLQIYSEYVLYTLLAETIPTQF